MEEETIAQHIEAWKQGDREALLPVIDWITPQLHRFLTAKTGSPGIAEDLTQDTMERMVTNLSRFQSGTNFRAWIFTIGLNVFRDHWRRNTRETSLPCLPSSATDAFDSVESTHNHRQLWQQVSRLSENERTIILLRHTGELSFRDIASMLGLPLGTVLSTQHRALIKLSRNVRM